MKKKVHSESEMVKSVKELESGVSAETVAGNYNITRGTLYNWINKYSGMEVSQVQKLKELRGRKSSFKAHTFRKSRMIVLINKCTS